MKSRASSAAFFRVGIAMLEVITETNSQNFLESQYIFTERVTDLHNFRI